jgi:hypothetical protein
VNGEVAPIAAIDPTTAELAARPIASMNASSRLQAREASKLNDFAANGGGCDQISLRPAPE